MLIPLYQKEMKHLGAYIKQTEVLIFFPPSACLHLPVSVGGSG